MYATKKYRSLISTTEILQRIIYLADRLIQLAKEDGDGVFWIDTLDSFSGHASVCRGSSGIILFYAELYKITRDNIYLALISATTNRIEIRARQTHNEFSFYTGRGGVVYTLLEVYKITNDKDFLERAERLAMEVNFDALLHEQKEFNLYEGLAGSVLVLLHLHSHTHSSWILETISHVVAQLLSRSRINRGGGIYWINEKNVNVITGLCGFACGNAGVGYMFLELAQYTSDPLFFWLADEVFLYEDTKFDDRVRNWPDFRRPTVTNKELIRIANRYQFGIGRRELSKHSYSEGWFAGKVGIVFSRMRKYELHPENGRDGLERILADVERHLRRPAENDYETPFNDNMIEYGLLVLHLYRMDRKPQHLENVRIMSETLWSKFQREQQNAKSHAGPFLGSNPGCTIGIASYGLLLAKLYHSLQDSSNYNPGIVRPDIMYEPAVKKSKLATKLSLDLTAVTKIILNNAFPKTLLLISNFLNDDEIYSSFHMKAISEVENKIGELVNELRSNVQVNDCWHFEKAIQSTNTFTVKRMEFCIKKLDEISRTRILISKKSKFKLLQTEKFILASDAIIHRSKWNWTRPGNSILENLKMKESDCISLLLANAEKVVVYEINEAQLSMLKKFETSNTPLVVFNQLCRENGIDDQSQAIDLLGSMFFDLVNIGALIVRKKFFFKGDR